MAQPAKVGGRRGPCGHGASCVRRVAAPARRPERAQPAPLLPRPAARHDRPRFAGGAGRSRRRRPAPRRQHRHPRPPLRRPHHRRGRTRSGDRPAGQAGPHRRGQGERDVRGARHPHAVPRRRHGPLDRDPVGRAARGARRAVPARAQGPRRDRGGLRREDRRRPAGQSDAAREARHRLRRPPQRGRARRPAARHRSAVPATADDRTGPDPSREAPTAAPARCRGVADRRAARPAREGGRRQGAGLPGQRADRDRELLVPQAPDGQGPRGVRAAADRARPRRRDRGRRSGTSGGRATRPARSTSTPRCPTCNRRPTSSSSSTPTAPRATRSTRSSRAATSS